MATVEEAAADGGDALRQASDRPLLKQTTFAEPEDAQLRSSTALMIASTVMRTVADVYQAMSLERLDAKALQFAPIQAVALRFNLRPCMVLLAAIAAPVGFFLFGLGGHFVCSVVGFLYPAFESFKALEAQDMEMVQFWLTYWVVFAMITFTEYATLYIITSFPFYYPLKLAFLFYLLSPAMGGSLKAYSWVVKPLLNKHRDAIDGMLEESRSRVRRGVKDAVDVAITAGMDTAVGAKSLGINSIRTGLSLAGPAAQGLTSLCTEVAQRARRASFSPRPKLTHAQTAPALPTQAELDADSDDGDSPHTTSTSDTADAAQPPDTAVGARAEDGASDAEGQGQHAAAEPADPPVFGGGRTERAEVACDDDDVADMQE